VDTGAARQSDTFHTDARWVKLLRKGFFEKKNTIRGGLFIFHLWATSTNIELPVSAEYRLRPNCRKLVEITDDLLLLFEDF